MLFRNKVNKLVNIEKNEFITDKEYYEKICEIYKKNNNENVVTEIKDAPIFKYIMNLL
tara:strand:+ start:701 stop:874 length:174 start_codon:yes stop_codon:yes gene_type:complete